MGIIRHFSAWRQQRWPKKVEPSTVEEVAAKPTATDPKADNEQGPWWIGAIPARYGAVDALNSMGNVAAPFLAGFSLAVSVQTLSLQPGATRWRETVLFLLVLAAVSLISTVQAMFWARQHLITPKDLMEWWPDWQHVYRRDLFSKWLREANDLYSRWSNVARAAYGVGILCLLSGLTVLMVPAECTASSAWRWAAAAVGGVATLGELVWVIVSFTRRADK